MRLSEAQFERWEQLRDIIHGREDRVIIDTPEKAAAEGLPIGTTVRIQRPPTRIATAAEFLEFDGLRRAM